MPNTFASAVEGQDDSVAAVPFLDVAATHRGISGGLDALQLTLCALGIGPGPEVVVPTSTFTATAVAVPLPRRRRVSSMSTPARC